MARARKTDPRTRDLARIHVLSKQLGLARDQYEAVLWTLTRKDSAAGLDAFERNLVIQHLERQVKLTFKGRPHNADAKARQVILKIEALLADAGRDWTYVESIMRRLFKGRKQRVEFCSEAELGSILGKLQIDALRRLVPELENLTQQSGWCWDYAQYAAAELFGHSYERDLRKNAHGVSQLVRWFKGELAPSCAMPVHEGSE